MRKKPLSDQVIVVVPKTGYELDQESAAAEKAQGSRLGSFSQGTVWS